MQKGISAEYQQIGEIGMNQNERATKQAETAIKIHINEELFKSGKITKSMYEFAKKQFLKDIAA